VLQNHSPEKSARTGPFIANHHHPLWLPGGLKYQVKEEKRKQGDTPAIRNNTFNPGHLYVITVVASSDNDVVYMLTSLSQHA